MDRRHRRINKAFVWMALLAMLLIGLSACTKKPGSSAVKKNNRNHQVSSEYHKDQEESEEIISDTIFDKTENRTEKETECEALTEEVRTESENAVPVKKGKEVIKWNPEWEYASFSKIHSGSAVLYHSDAVEPKNITIAVNAGHGTKGGDRVRTLCHPDGSPKVTGGSTAAGSTTATAIAGGMTFADGTPEAAATLALARQVKWFLLENGYDVLMIRDDDDVQLDNIARTVLANQKADCHIALHYDATESDKGLFYCRVPQNDTYRGMEPVASHYKEHIRLGDALVEGARENGVKIFGGNIETDLTQTSYSTVPSVDLEVGDSASDISEDNLRTVAEGVLKGVDIFFGR